MFVVRDLFRCVCVFVLWGWDGTAWDGMGWDDVYLEKWLIGWLAGWLICLRCYVYVYINVL